MARAWKAVVGELLVGFLLGCLVSIGKSANLVKWRLSGWSVTSQVVEGATYGSADWAREMDVC